MSLRKKLNQIAITWISWMQWMRKLEFWAFKSMHSPGEPILFGLTQANLTCDQIALKDKSTQQQGMTFVRADRENQFRL